MESKEVNGWIKAIAGPLISALITGGIMYTAVRVELAQVEARQEMVLRTLESIRLDIKENRDMMINVRERVTALEVSNGTVKNGH